MFITEARLARKGESWVALDGVNGDTQWRRYSLDDCDTALLARATQSPGEGDPVSVFDVIALSNYQGLGGAIKTAPRIAREIFSAVRSADLLVVRTPGPLSTLAVLAARVSKIPYAVEVVGDIYEVLALGSIPGIRRLAPLGRLVTQWICAAASAGRFVTRETLQQTYPVKNGPTIAISNVQIADSQICQTPRLSRHHRNELRLIAVGTQEVPYKGHDIALQAVALLCRNHPSIDFSLELVGGGRLHEELKSQAQTLGIDDSVSFRGQLSPKEVVEAIDNADVLLQPSLSEGLPRTVIEAMSRALPVVGSRVGGIPELVAPEFLINPGDAEELSSILALLLDDSVYHKQSSRSLEESAKYALSELDHRFATWSDWLSSIAHRREVVGQDI
ncbi:glycosyltransferase family 4 protein [Corynebacterium atrinae]|uniref:glycosyltransferase family 4 protein n=1 Tax=Corynebacterium atrinae TaxID=1336740 RepID=UPI0025B2EE9D|nr:glycosyltransferase family 4 protein [Corynebacterium atrinae]